MAKLEFTKTYNGSTIKPLEWDVFVQIFDEVWGSAMHSLPSYPEVMNPVRGHWLDEEAVKHIAESLEEIGNAYKAGEVTKIIISSTLGNPSIILSYLHTNRSVLFEIISDQEEKVRTALAIVRKNFPLEPRPSEDKINNYVHLSRLKELILTKSEKFDLVKLIRLCEELNIAFSNNSYYSVLMIVRSIINHVPPIFDVDNFEQVIGTHGNKSFKESMKNLNFSSRKIADSYLHDKIQKKEVLPNSNQVNFIQELDLLLSDVVRVLKNES